MFRELPTPVELEEEVLRHWKDNRIFERTLEQTRGRPEFVFYEGPPTANGTPHNGHVLTRVIKDLFPRYRTMRGFHVNRKAGWDTHGLPVEIEVEKELGMRAKGSNAREAVLAYGLDNFAKKCVESVFKYTTDWEQLTERVGFWVDLEDAYVTYHRSYVESVWWALSELFSRDLLYQGHKVVWWWPEGGTALSAGEVGEGYRDVDDPSVTVRFPVVGQPGTSFLAWTTTPWTLPSNVALAVGPDVDYAFVQLEDEVVIVADALKPDGEVLKLVKGAELVGMRYEPLYTWVKPEGGKSYEVVAGDHVNTSSGTGIVHTAPAYGEEDFALMKQTGLALLQLVGTDGTFGETAPEWVQGLHFKAADKPIMRDLRERGRLYKGGTVRHSYPFSPRSKDDPLIQMARPGWFIRTTAFKDDALENNAGVNWLPGHIKEGRFGDFLRNNVDWALSRERFWGTPLPIWCCAACGEKRAYGSVAELEAAGAQGFDPDVDRHLQVHKPWIDNVTVPCACGETMNRVTEVIDCWFDSGCMPFAQWGFPHQNVDRFQQAFPADFISEAVDQTRGWFYSLMMISTMLFDDETCEKYGLDAVGFPRPYRNCVVLGHVGDMEGKKESKSTGNYTSPQLVLRGRMRMRVVSDANVKRGTVLMGKAAVRSLDLASNEHLSLTAAEAKDGAVQVKLKGGKSPGKETIAVHPDDAAAWGVTDTAWLHAPFQPPGADAFRWLFYAANPPWTNTRLSMRAIREGQREFHLRLANVFQFFSIYANIAEFDPSSTTLPVRRGLLDRWISAELQALVNTVTEQLDAYRIYEAARAISTFVDGLSNWYVRRSRSRFWGEGPDTSLALRTLFEVLSTLSKVIAPFVPFMADAMHSRLGLRGDSVHMCRWPKVREISEEDEALRRNMALVRELSSLGLSARARVGVRVRQPLSAVEVILADAEQVDGLAELLPLISEELNVREIRFTQDADRFVLFRVKPNYPRLGKRLGKDMKLCAAALNKADAVAVRRGLLSGGYTVDLPSGPLLLSEEDVVVEVQPKPHFEASGSAAAVVVLHADLDDDLREEGLAREVINRIQSARKEAKLGYTDRILVQLGGDAAVRTAVERFREHICKETLTVSLQVHALDSGVDHVDDHPFSLDIEPAG